MNTQIICTECGTKFELQPPKRGFLGTTSAQKRSALGFPKHTCPQCKKTFLYPLDGGTKLAYWLIVVVVAYFILLFIASANSPGVSIRPGPGFIIIALLATLAITALTKNSSIKQAKADAETKTPKADA